MAAGPALPHPSQKLLFVFFHLADECLIASIFVRGGPEHHCGEHRRQIDSFRGQQVDDFARVFGVWVRHDDAVSLQFAQTIGQDIRRDAFVALQEFLVGARTLQHHVADDQQRPAIAQHLHGSVQRTPRPPFWTCLFSRHLP